MTDSHPVLAFGTNVQAYAVSNETFLSQHPEYDLVCTGVAVFNQQGKLLLVQRSREETAFPNAWEMPGGKVDDSDATILHAAARELHEEAGLTATRIVGNVTQFTFEDGRAGQTAKTWLKLVFAMEVVGDASHITLDAVEHQAYVFASEAEVAAERVGPVRLAFMSAANKAATLEAFGGGIWWRHLVEEG